MAQRSPWSRQRATVQAPGRQVRAKLIVRIHAGKLFSSYHQISIRDKCIVEFIDEADQFNDKTLLWVYLDQTALSCDLCRIKDVPFDPLWFSFCISTSNLYWSLPTSLWTETNALNSDLLRGVYKLNLIYHIMDYNCLELYFDALQVVLRLRLDEFN